MTDDRVRFLAAVTAVALLGTDVYLKVNGHGEWNWLFVALAVLAPFLLGVSTGKQDQLPDDNDEDA